MNKKLDHQARNDLLNQMRLKYHKASKNDKSEMINALIMSAGYRRYHTMTHFDAVENHLESIKMVVAPLVRVQFYCIRFLSKRSVNGMIPSLAILPLTGFYDYGNTYVMQRI